MTNPDQYDEVWRQRGAESMHDSFAGEEHERGRPNQPLLPAEPTGLPIIVDLWSAPESAVAVGDDQLDEDLFGSWGAQADTGARPVNAGDVGIPHTTKRPDSDRGLGSPGADEDRPRRSASGVALAIAVVILISLGFVARQFDSSAGSGDEPSSSQQRATNRSAPLSPVASSRPFPRTSASPVVADESHDCPMRLKSHEKATEPSSFGRSHCFFIE